jgi:hypothetical protein
LAGNGFGMLDECRRLLDHPSFIEFVGRPDGAELAAVVHFILTDDLNRY